MCFCKITVAWELSVLKELFSYWKFHGICPRFHGPGARQRGPPAHRFHKTRAFQITMEGSDAPGEGVRLFSNLGHYEEDGQRGSTQSLGAVVLGHWHNGCHCNTARAGQSSTPRLLKVRQLELVCLKWCGDIGDTHPGFNRGGGWLQGGWQHRLNLPGLWRHRTALHEILRPKDGFPSFLVLSSRSPLVQLLWEAVDWCMWQLLWVLGFDLKHAEIRALWPPIYRGFGLISKTIRSWSCFDPSIRLVYALDGINPKGKNSRYGTSLEQTRSGCWPWVNDAEPAGLH
jgi:hypothetical protein